MATTLARTRDDTAPVHDRPGEAVNRVTPTTLLAITMFEFAALVWLLLAWQFGWARVDRLPNPIFGVLPLIVPWGGALGGVAISYVGLAEHWSKWSTRTDEGARWNAWYLMRPFIGSIMGTIGGLILVLLLGTIGTDGDGAIDTSPRGAATLMLIAFVVGYRQATFAELIGRAVDVILGPGDQAATLASAIVPDTLEVATAPNAPVEAELSVANDTTTSMHLPRTAFAIGGEHRDVFSISRYPGTIPAKGDGILKIRYAPQHAGTHIATLTIDTPVSTESVTLTGTCTR